MDEAQLADAVRAMHEAHAPALRAWARQHVADPADADEVVQETLVRAWRHQDQFDPARGSERAWLFGIARNVAIDGHRRQRRHLRAVSAWSTGPEHGDGGLERAVETSHVRDALRVLSEAHRSVIIETYYQGSSVKEAAQRLGLPEGTMKSRLYYGLRALRGELERREVLP